MIKVGITGGIGSGKSYISRNLEDRGFQVFDCDSRAKKLMTEDEGVRHKIMSVLGQNAYEVKESRKGKQTWIINKSVVSDFLFRDADNAETINNIVHPRLAEVFEDWAKRQNDDIVFMEAAILFESGFDKFVDFTVLVFADEETRLRRATKRDGCSDESVRQRMAQQMNTLHLKNKVDFIIYNNDNDIVDSQIDKLLILLNNKL